MKIGLDTSLRVPNCIINSDQDIRLSPEKSESRTARALSKSAVQGNHPTGVRRLEYCVSDLERRRSLKAGRNIWASQNDSDFCIKKESEINRAFELFVESASHREYYYAQRRLEDDF
jgi:hypothetical protein